MFLCPTCREISSAEPAVFFDRGDEVLITLEDDDDSVLCEHCLTEFRRCGVEVFWVATAEPNDHEPQKQQKPLFE